jgi:hypothetical protein
LQESLQEEIQELRAEKQHQTQEAQALTEKCQAHLAEKVCLFAQTDVAGVLLILPS